jgi:hypothetical protein
MPIGKRIPHTNVWRTIWKSGCRSSYSSSSNSRSINTYMDIHDPVDRNLGVDFSRIMVSVSERWKLDA